MSKFIYRQVCDGRSDLIPKYEDGTDSLVCGVFNEDVCEFFEVTAVHPFVWLVDDDSNEIEWVCKLCSDLMKLKQEG